METISFVVPLPPTVIRSNSRSPWGHRVGRKQRYSEQVYAAWMSDDTTYSGGDIEDVIAWLNRDEDEPWQRARVTFTWKACHLPDQANVLPNCKALLDILCMAPKSTQPNNTTYLGLIEDDKGVEAIGKVEKVAHRHQEGVQVTIERL